MISKLNNQFDQQLAAKEQSHAAAIKKLLASHEAEIKAHKESEQRL